MDIADMLRNDAQFVAGYSAAVDSVEWLIMHSENPVESLKLWVQSQGTLCDELDAMRDNVLPGMSAEGPVENKRSMSRAQWEAILGCIIMAENSSNSSAIRDADTAREWFDRQEWDD